jgi:hypothetical protein
MAMHLLTENYDGIRHVAMRARRDSYFKFSVQKRLKEITELLAVASSRNSFFDKFLPL